MASSIWTNALIIILVIFLLPIIMYFFERHLRKGFPAKKEISKILSKIDKNAKLKKKMERYCKTLMYLGAFTWLGFVMLQFFAFFSIYDAKYGPNSPVYILPIIVLFSSLGPILNSYYPVVIKIFKSRNPDVDPKHFLVFSAYYFPNDNYKPSRNVNYLKFNEKLLKISMIIFILSLSVSILFAVV
jgi:hypothetical protein